MIRAKRTLFFFACGVFLWAVSAAFTVWVSSDRPDRRVTTIPQLPTAKPGRVVVYREEDFLPIPTQQPNEAPLKTVSPVVSPPVSVSDISDAEVLSAQESADGSVELSVQRDPALVVRVIDGDTIELESGETVRYIGIDTPETTHPFVREECYGKAAKEKNASLVLNTTVELEADVSNTDKYGRLLRYVWVDGIFVNEYMVRQGFANAVSYPPDVRYQTLFFLAEEDARVNNRGLWGSCPVSLPTVLPDQSGDSEQRIKGNISSDGEKIYHLPHCSSYGRTVIDETKGERWFDTEDEALRAGFRKSGTCP